MVSLFVNSSCFTAESMLETTTSSVKPKRNHIVLRVWVRQVSAGGGNAHRGTAIKLTVATQL